MMMMKARKAMVYDGRNLVAGEVFDCPVHDEPVLVQGGLAEAYYGDDSPTVVQRVKRRYRRRDIQAEE